MPVEHSDPPAAAALIARARDAMAHAPTRLTAIATDLGRAEDERLDDRLRAALEARMAADIDGLTRELRLAAARELGALGADAAARALLDEAPNIHDRLRRAGLLADPALLAEWLDATRLALLEQTLISGTVGGDQPSLLVRLIECPDAAIAAAASSLLIVASLPERGAARELPGALRARLIWWIAAALGRDLGDDPRAAFALTEAAEAVIAVHEDQSRPDALAIDLARAIAPTPAELPELLAEAIGDRRLALVAALMAATGGLDQRDARAILVDPDAARLGLLLRAQGLDRTAIARIVVALAQGDPRRDLERFADELDALAAISPERAANSFAPLVTHPAYRAALTAVGAGR